MVTLIDLLLPILLSAVLVFVVSSVVHMVLPIHKGDAKKLPGEAEILDGMRAQGVVPGDYMFPCAGSMKDMATPEMLEKFRLGPVGFVTVMPAGPPAIGKSLMQWFVYCLVVGVFVGYAGRLTLEAGSAYMVVFRHTGAVAMLGYAFGNVQSSIWKGVSWTITLKFMFDGLLYALVTAGCFAWLWPAGA